MNGRIKVRVLSSQQINLFISMCQKGGNQYKNEKFWGIWKNVVYWKSNFFSPFFRSSESFCSFWLFFYIKTYLSSLTFFCELQFLVSFFSFMFMPSIQQFCEAKKVFLNDIRPSPQFFLFISLLFFSILIYS